jgi:GDP-D-mannose 3',5'-epimerase
MNSDVKVPLNLGSSEMVNMNDFVQLIIDIEKAHNSEDNFVLKHLKGPEGVRGRNSDNTQILERLGWEPTTPLKEGIRYTYNWIKDEINKEQNSDVVKSFIHSSIVSKINKI